LGGNCVAPKGFENKIMRILFVAMPDSVHTARWITQITNQGWELYLFPAYIGPVHVEMPKITVFGSMPLRRKNRKCEIRFVWWTVLLFWVDYLVSKVTRSPSQGFTENALTTIIRWIRPNVVHSLEIQKAGYLTLGAKQKLAEEFPPWIVTNWGSDIFLFGRLSEHKVRIQKVLEQCDYYSCECQRDISLAEKLGFSGKILPVLPNTGGFNMKDAATLRGKAKPSKRQKILLKGYQHFAGRSLTGLQALRLCVDQLKGFSLTIFSAADMEIVTIAAELFEQDTQIPVEIIPVISHNQMLQLYGESRIYIGLSISDAISTSLLESMAMGAFPIQSDTSCAIEWIDDGISGIIVPPENPKVISEAILRALSDDALVDKAAEINSQTIKQRLDYSLVSSIVVDTYLEIEKENIK